MENIFNHVVVFRYNPDCNCTYKYNNFTIHEEGINSVLKIDHPLVDVVRYFIKMKVDIDLELICRFLLIYKYKKAIWVSNKINIQEYLDCIPKIALSSKNFGFYIDEWTHNILVRDDIFGLTSGTRMFDDVIRHIFSLDIYRLVKYNRIQLSQAISGVMMTHVWINGRDKEFEVYPSSFITHELNSKMSDIVVNKLVSQEINSKLEHQLLTLIK